MTTSTKPRGSKALTGSARALTKKDQLIKLLRTKAGADIQALSKKLGWQQHTTRAAMSGLRKAGYGIESAVPAKGGLSKYRIVAEPEPERTTSATGATHAG